MKLINDFFHIEAIETKGKDIVATINMNSAHSIYHAHFPGNPITPGVCLVQMSTELLEIGLTKHLNLQNAVKIKFKKPMAPSVRPTFTFQKILITESQVSVQVTIEDSGTQYAKMNLIYTIII